MDGWDDSTGSTEVSSEGGALVSVEEMRKQAAAEAALIKSRLASAGSDFIRVTTDKKFKLPGEGKDSPGHEAPMSVVIIDFAAANQYFDRPFRQGEQAAPACYASGMSAINLVPTDNSPVKQNDNCNECWANQWGSAGAGKACNNTRILAVVEPTSQDPATPIYLLKVSKTAVKAFDSYISQIRSAIKSLPISVITEMYFDPNNQFPSLRFKVAGSNPNFGIHWPRREEAKTKLLEEPDFSKYEPLPQKGNKK